MASIEVTIDSGAIDAMVGRYQIAPNVVLTISRQGNRVFAQITGQPPAEIFASSQRQFFYKVVDAQLTFEGDEQGRLTAVVLHQGGRELRAVRVE